MEGGRCPRTVAHSDYDFELGLGAAHFRALGRRRHGWPRGQEQPTASAQHLFCSIPPTSRPSARKCRAQDHRRDFTDKLPAIRSTTPVAPELLVSRRARLNSTIRHQPFQSGQQPFLRLLVRPVVFFPTTRRPALRSTSMILSGFSSWKSWLWRTSGGLNPEEIRTPAVSAAPIPPYSHRGGLAFCEFPLPGRQCPVCSTASPLDFHENCVNCTSSRCGRW